MTTKIKYVSVYHNVAGVGCYKVARVRIPLNLQDTVSALRYAKDATISGEGLKWWNRPDLACISNCRDTVKGDILAIVRMDETVEWYKVTGIGFVVLKDYPIMAAI